MLRQEIQRLRDDLKRARQQGSFARNVMHTFRGNAMVTLSQLLLTPIVARIYGPDAYGVYGLFMAICANLATVADLGYTPAYMLEAGRERFLDMVRLGWTLLAGVLVLMLPFLFSREAVFDLFPAWATLGGWWYLLPFGVIVSALPAIQLQWLFREDRYAAATTIGGVANVALRLFNIVFGSISRGALHGLIVGELLVKGVQAMLLARVLRPLGWWSVFRGWSWHRVRSIAVEYKRYPLFVFPERWVALAGMQAPIFFMAAWPDAVGRYTFATTILLLPLRQIGFSLGNVFQRKAAEVERERPMDLPVITQHLFRRLVLVGTPLYMAATFFGDTAFALALGEPWRTSGAFAAALAPFFLLRLFTEPIGSLAYVRKYEALPLWFQSALLIARVAVLLAARPYGPGEMILAFALVSAVGYVVQTALLLRVAGVRPAKLLLYTVAWALLWGIAMSVARYAFIGQWWPPF